MKPNTEITMLRNDIAIMTALMKLGAHPDQLAKRIAKSIARLDEISAEVQDRTDRAVGIFE